MHWKKERSIKSLSDECGVSRDTFQRQAKNRHIKLRNIKDACSLTLNKGDKHWANGLRKENSSWANMNSERMKTNNPNKDIEVRRKRAKTISKTFIRNVLPQEAMFKNILDKKSIAYEMQKPIEGYNVDFFIEPNKCIEIDSTDKWGKTRRSAAAKKDKLLSQNGFEVIRINKRWLSDLSCIIDILVTNNVISHK